MQIADLFSVAGKRVVITGGARGIGLMLATAFAQGGAHVHLVGRDTAGLERVAAELAAFAPCTATRADLSTGAGVDALADVLLADGRAIDVLVNNAGAAWLDELGRHPDAELDALLAVNVKAPLRLVERLEPALRRAARPGAPARVINIGSIDGIAVSPVRNYGYAGSKAAVHQITRHLARYLAPDITVNAIAPGLFDTAMNAGLLADPAHRGALLGAIPLKRAGEPDDLAGAAIYLASHAGAWVTGVVLAVDGGESGA